MDTIGKVYWVDVTDKDHTFRLASRLEECGWVASVSDMNIHQELHTASVNGPDEGKSEAVKYAQHLIKLPPLEWQSRG